MRLHIFDNGFFSGLGHHFEYTTTIYDVWVRQGGDAFIYSSGQKEMEVSKKYKIIPLFKHGMHEIHSPIRLHPFLNGLLNLFAGNHFYWRDLKKLARQTFSNSDIVLIHTINHSMLPAVYLWYRSLPKENSPVLVLLFRYNNAVYAPDKRYLLTHKIYKVMLDLFDKLAAYKKVIYAADTDALAEEYEELTEKKVFVFPIPHTSKLLNGPLARGSAADKITIVYLGDARDEKGYYLIPDAIELVLREALTMKLEFIIQSNTSDYSGKMTIMAKEKLKAFNGRVTMIDRSLGTAEYYNLLGGADAVLIPYRAKDYYARSSGIFTEALAFGKSVIVPRNTWMERQLSQCQGGGVIFQDGDPRSLADAILEFLNNRSSIGERARLCAVKWTNHHNPKNYVDTLLKSVHSSST